MQVISLVLEERFLVKQKKKNQLLTLTVPTMFGCSRQKYGYSPASVKVKLNVCPGFSNGVKFGEELNLLSGCPLLPDVTVWGCESLFVHVTVVPTLT